jgi:RimJ/RimL family protein N-acetyltransferase
MIHLAVERATAQWPRVETVFATIDPDNEASIHAFESVGFMRDPTGGRFVLDLEAHSDSR